MKLGICCVYFYGPGSDWLLDLQLHYIAKTLAGYDYTIYAVANRLQPELRARLESAPNLKIVSLPTYDGTGSPEHAHYIDLLLRHAAENGCTHLATLDSDSFPVLDDWPKLLLRRMDGLRIAAVLRAENFDSFLPHPCGLFMDTAFLIDRSPHMLPSREEISGSRSFREFLEIHHQRPDTGIGYGYALWKASESWLPLTRTNRHEPHFLMAGIYGDIFFHLGASSRTLRFYADTRTRVSRRIGARLAGVPLLWRLSKWIDANYIAGNRRTFMRIVNELRANPDAFLRRLS